MVTQNGSTAFEFDKFMALSGPNLWQYCDRVAGTSVPQPTVQRIIAELESFDDDHLCFIVDNCPSYEGSEFTPLIPQFLAHSSRQVRLAASRKLQHLEHVSKDVYELVKRFWPQFPEREPGENILELVSKKVR